MNETIVYVVTENDADIYCGYYVIGVFSKREYAVEHCTGNNRHIIERPLDIVIAK